MPTGVISAPGRNGKLAYSIFEVKSRKQNVGIRFLIYLSTFVGGKIGIRPAGDDFRPLDFYHTSATPRYEYVNPRDEIGSFTPLGRKGHY